MLPIHLDYFFFSHPDRTFYINQNLSSKLICLQSKFRFIPLFVRYIPWAKSHAESKNELQQGREKKTWYALLSFNLIEKQVCGREWKTK